MASLRMFTMRRAYSASTFPASVSETSCTSRAKSGAPTSSSSALTLSLTVCCVRQTRSSARVQVPSSTTARKCSSCSKSIVHAPELSRVELSFLDRRFRHGRHLLNDALLQHHLLHLVE